MTAPDYFNSDTHCPTFGKKLVDQKYFPRPGAYALIFDAYHSVALLRVKQRYFLPGGGAEPGETSVETVRREVYEECGYEIVVGVQLGVAVDYIFAQNEGKYYEIQSVFWEAWLGRKVSEPCEADHELVWLEAAKAHTLLERPGQKWALRKACERSGIHM